MQRAAAPRLLADASSDASLAADLRRPFDWLTSRRMHKVARQHRATLLQDNTQENRDNQVDCPVNDAVCNDEALTSGGERFASSSTNPDRVTHDLGLGKAIVVPHSSCFDIMYIIGALPPGAPIPGCHHQLQRIERPHPE